MNPSRHKNSKNFLRQYFPILEWLPQYQLSWLRADIIAGLTVWAVMIPESMAYAGIAGVPPLIGLYTVPFPLFFYALLGTSRLMVVGPDSATALISSVTVAALASSGSQEYLILTSAIAFTVGICFLIFGLFKMGWVADFIPTPVMKGFIQGLVWVTIIGQVPKLLGIIREAKTPVKMVLIDAETINMIDTTALEMLDKLQSELAKKEIILAWARLRDHLYQKMCKVGLDKKIGEHNFYERISDGVAEFVRKNELEEIEGSYDERQP